MNHVITQKSRRIAPGKSVVKNPPHDIDASSLRDMSVPDLIGLFKTLEAPTIVEMDGEFDATLLRQPSVFATLSGAVMVRNPLSPWRAKAFRPVDATGGRGYNTFRPVFASQDVRMYPMLTAIARSRYDGRPVYQLDYRPFDTLNGRINMIDEIRRVKPGLYLGFGTWGLSARQQMIPLPFSLVGPARPYVGDVGSERS